MNKQCQNCSVMFEIALEDLNFYAKISVPPPTFCSHCRYQRRLSWRNTRNLFRKKDAKTGQIIFSIFPEESPVKIYERDYWRSDGWDPMEYGRDYDWSRTFFEQFKNLLYSVPLPAHSVTNLSNCEYCTNANYLKNCYLVYASSYSEDSLYLIWDYASKRSLDSHMTNRCELSCGNINTIRCHKTFFSADCEDCQEVTLSKDCMGCSNCFGCIGLRNKSYYIFNEPHTKETYADAIKKFDIGSARNLAELTERAHAHWKKYLHKFMHGRQNASVSGDYISASKNAQQCFRIRGTQDSKFCQNFLEGPAKDCYDYTNWGENTELIYESLIVGMGAYNIRFSSQVYENVKNIEYSYFCHNSSDLFGCVSLKNKQYCIFNKQYAKEDFEKLRSKIIEHMINMPYLDSAGRVYRYGEFFPPELSPFPYEATEAFEFFPIDEKEAKAKGFALYPTEKQSYSITLKNPEIPDRIRDAEDSILLSVIECAHADNCKEECRGAFRIVRDELEFYRQMDIALPRLCPNCRHYSRLKLRNQPIFYERECECVGLTSKRGGYKNSAKHMHGVNTCSNKFETSYAPDRAEIVYCEACYNQEVA